MLEVMSSDDEDNFTSDGEEGKHNVWNFFLDVVAPYNQACLWKVSLKTRCLRGQRCAVIFRWICQEMHALQG